MIEDSVLQEVRAAREAFARKHGYDLRSMMVYLRQQDERGDWPVVRLAPRPAAPPIDLRSGPASTNATTSIPARDHENSGPAAEVQEARQEFAEGLCRPSSPDGLMNEILS